MKILNVIFCRGKTKPKDDETLSELGKAKILFEVRSLKVGDFAWVARCRLTNKELVLPYIVERKTLEDLSSSIKDGRYHEQKVIVKFIRRYCYFSRSNKIIVITAILNFEGSNFFETSRNTYTGSKKSRS